MTKKWMQITLITAGLYNILWGCWVVFFPKEIFILTKTKLPLYLEIWQCVGMIVAVYGVGYLVAAKSPLKHWPIILVGLLGKILGPIGFFQALYNGVFPLEFGINIIFNDLIWWIPFSIILYLSLQSKRLSNHSINISHESFSNFSDRKRVKFINSLSGVKSTNLIGTINKNGKTNLSIVSSVFHLGADPALLGFIIRPDTARRDTLCNIRETNSFTINHVNRKILKKAHQTSARYDKEISEFDSCGLTPEYLDNNHSPFVKESHIKMAIEFIREIKIEENGTHLIIGKISEVILPKNCLENDGSVDINKAGTVAVSGLDTYLDCEIIGRLSYAKPNKDLEWI